MSRILVVDDEPSIAKTLVDLLAMHRFPAVSAASGEEALEVLTKEAIDLVLLDVRLPGLDGIEVSKRVAEEDPERVIVLVSSADPRELSPLAKNSGAAALLRKHWLTPRLLRGLWVAHRRR